jgi:hypothetical protein
MRNLRPCADHLGGLLRRIVLFQTLLAFFEGGTAHEFFMNRPYDGPPVIERAPELVVLDLVVER